VKIICAPDSFKGSLSAMQAARAMARGILNADPDTQVDLCPISDGGEGFASTIAHANRHTQYARRCRGPLGHLAEASWYIVHQKADQDIAVIEIASAAGLGLLTQDQRDPAKTTTFGVGELITHAIDHGVRHILLGIGGSATNDGGCGMAQALGARFYDADDQLTDAPITGGMLGTIGRIDVSQLKHRLHGISVTVASDVTNPLTGPNGAAHIYGPQKGATPAQVEQLDHGLRHLATLWRDQLGIDVENTPGAGAAGGLGGGLLAFSKAELRSGLDIVLEMVRFDQRVQGCDLCLTGEGSLDGQSLAGKAVLGVAHAATKHNVPTIALVGSLGPGHEKAIDAGLKDAIEIGRGRSIEESMARASEFLEQATAKAVSLHSG
jgi:glycerate 2-kinase